MISHGSIGGKASTPIYITALYSYTKPVSHLWVKVIYVCVYLTRDVSSKVGLHYTGSNARYLCPRVT